MIWWSCRRVDEWIIVYDDLHSLYVIVWHRGYRRGCDICQIWEPQIPQSVFGSAVISTHVWGSKCGSSRPSCWLYNCLVNLGFFWGASVGIFWAYWMLTHTPPQHDHGCDVSKMMTPKIAMKSQGKLFSSTKEVSVCGIPTSTASLCLFFPSKIAIWRAYPVFRPTNHIVE